MWSWNCNYYYGLRQCMTLHVYAVCTRECVCICKHNMLISLCFLLYNVISLWFCFHSNIITTTFTFLTFLHSIDILFAISELLFSLTLVPLCIFTLFLTCFL